MKDCQSKFPSEVPTIACTKSNMTATEAYPQSQHQLDTTATEVYPQSQQQIATEAYPQSQQQLDTTATEAYPQSQQQWLAHVHQAGCCGC